MECTLHGGHVAQSELSALTVPPILILSTAEMSSVHDSKNLSILSSWTSHSYITFLLAWCVSPRMRAT